MEFKATLDETLRARFLEDEESRWEMHDVYMHGIMGGFNGFIYSSELYDFFEKYDSEIEDMLHECNIKLDEIVTDPDDWTYQELRERSVWIAVELWISQTLDRLEDEKDCALKPEYA